MKTKILILLISCFVTGVSLNAQSYKYRYERGHQPEWSDHSFDKSKLNKHAKRHLRAEKRQLKRLKKHMLRDGRLDPRERHILRKKHRQHQRHLEHHRLESRRGRHCR